MRTPVKVLLLAAIGSLVGALPAHSLLPPEPVEPPIPPPVWTEPAPVVPEISINDLSKPESNEGSGRHTFILSLSNPSDQPVSVSFTTADGTATIADADYLIRAGTKTFLPGQVIKTINPLVMGDGKVEPDEYFFVNLSSPVNATIADSQGIGTIRNDDVAP
jgi:hypothetical protein